MNKKQLSERYICTKFITPSLRQAGWDEMTQLREEVSFTKGRTIVRGKLVTRGKAKRADYILYYKPNIPSRSSKRRTTIAPSANRVDRLADRGKPKLGVRFHLEHLEALTLRPEHIQRFRATIYRLGFHGKLSEHLPEDGLGADLLKAIKGEGESVGSSARSSLTKEQELDSPLCVSKFTAGTVD